MTDPAATPEAPPTADAAAPDEPAGAASVDDVAAWLDARPDAGEPESGVEPEVEAPEIEGDAPAAPADPNVVELPDFELIETRAKERAAEAAAAAPMQERMAAFEAQFDAKLAKLDALLARATPEAEPAPALPPDQVAFADALDKRLAPLLERLDKATAPPPPPTTPDLATAQGVFSEYVGGAAERFPKLAALPAEYRGDVGFAYVNRLRMAGYDTTRYSDEQIAQAVERSLSTSPGTNAAQGSPPTTQAQSPGTPPAADGGAQTGPRSITNGIVADSTRQPPRTANERFEDTVAWLDTRNATG